MSSGEAVVWAGSGTAWPSVSWGEPMAELLGGLGWQVALVPWGDPAAEHRGRPDVLHVFTDGLEQVGSGTAAMAERLDAVRSALETAAEDRASVLGTCLGAHMIAAVAGGVLPEPVPGGAVAGTRTVHGYGLPDLHVATAHVVQVPESFLRTRGVRLTWSSAGSSMQGFTLGTRVAGVQFHPELCDVQADWAVNAFTHLVGVAPSRQAHGDLAPARTVGHVLALTGAHRLAGLLPV